MTPEQIIDRFDMLVEQEKTAPQHGLWWLSFADPNIDPNITDTFPDAPGFLGVCIIAADGPMTALRISHQLAINPGGQVLQVGPYALNTWEHVWWNRLLDSDDIQALKSSFLEHPDPTPPRTCAGVD